MTTFQHPRIARKFGPSFGRSDFIPSASVGYRELGKVKVDCRFCLSKSRWGFLEDDSYGCPGGILYMDLSFDQPKGCRLSSATVLVTLDHEDGPPVLGQEMQPSLLQVTNYFGPRQLSGQEKSVAVKSTYSLTPNVNVLGNGGGGIGKNIEKSQTYTSRWTFTGSLQPGKDKNKGRRGVRTMTYKTIKWELSENDLDPGASHSNVFHTAFAFGHEERPCYIHVEIDGKLQRVRDRIKKNLKFPPSRKEEEGKTTIRMDLEHSEVYTTNCLDPIAKGLARAMEMANYEEVPVELPSAIEPSFQEVDPIDGSPPAVLSTTANAGKPKHSIHRITPTSPLMLEAPSSVLQDPILQSLARAQASFPIAQRTQPVRLADRNIREGSSLSSASTLVEQDNRIEEVENDWPTVGKAEKENKVKDETVYQELIVRIIQSPALRLFIQILVHILDFFSMGQLFTEETPPFEQGKLVEDQEDYGNSGPGPEDKFTSKKTSQDYVFIADRSVPNLFSHDFGYIKETSNADGQATHDGMPDFDPDQAGRQLLFQRFLKGTATQRLAFDLSKPQSIFRHINSNCHPLISTLNPHQLPKPHHGKPLPRLPRLRPLPNILDRALPRLRPCLRSLARHRYDRDGGVVLALAPGIYILHGGSGGTDVSKLRRANRQADEETRARFARDTDVHTGTSRHPEEGWWKATRGEKLRSSGDHRGMYGGLLEMRQEEKTSLETTLKDHPNDAATKARLAKVDTSIAAIHRMQGMVDQLEQMVREETNAGWDWMAGVKAQMDLRKEQAGLAGDIGSL